MAGSTDGATAWLISSPPRPGGRAGYPLAAESVTIGRERGCDVVLESPYISRLHARVVRRGGAYAIVDEQSTGGTFHNRRRVQGAHLLAPGDAIWLGAAACLLFLRDAPLDLVTPPLRYDPRRRQILAGGRALPLAGPPLRLLAYLYRQAGVVCAPAACARAVWGPARPPHDYPRQLSGLAAALRQALGGYDGRPELLQEWPGMGYVLVAEPARYLSAGR